MSPLFRGSSNGPWGYRILDLGCGQYASSLNLLHNDVEHYWGIDQIKPGARRDVDPFWAPETLKFVEADYRTLDFKTLGIESKQGPMAFTSLFSAEPTANAVDNTKLYERVFSDFEECFYGVVAGFYYRSKLPESVVEETGGIKSYQSLPGLPEASSVYHEVRLEVDAPSAMFGPDVVEVWRFLYNRAWAIPR
jgi:hypothetical protein